MAGVVTYEPDVANGRAFSMWAEGGLQFRSNLLFEVGAVIPLHAHSYDHVSMVTHGWFQVEETLPDGTVKEYQMASRGFVPQSAGTFDPIGYQIVIPAWHKHLFTLIESQQGPGEVLCMWPIGGDK